MPRFAPRRRATTITAGVCAIGGALALAIVGFSARAPQTGLDEPLFRFLLWAQQSEGFEWITFEVLEGLANVLLFVPIGAIAFLLLPRRVWPLSLLLGPALSLGIEFGQAVLLPGRVASLEDVALNSLGALIGFGLAAAISLAVAARAARRGETTNSGVAVSGDSAAISGSPMSTG